MTMNLTTNTRKAMDKALLMSENYNTDGSVNWDFIDADAYMDTFAFDVDPSRGLVADFYAEFDRYADEITAK